jgi:hypothetical protein
MFSVKLFLLNLLVALAVVRAGSHENGHAYRAASSFDIPGVELVNKQCSDENVDYKQPIQVEWTDPLFLDKVAMISQTSGVVMLNGLENSVLPPYESIQAFFDMLHSNHSIAERCNNLYPKRGVYKDASIRRAPRIDSAIPIDRKVPFDLSYARVAALAQDPDLVQALGPAFANIRRFFSMVEQRLIPRLLNATAVAVGKDLTREHDQRNYNFRVLDYFARSNQEEGPRCGEHRDYGTFTIIFQDNTGGLEYLDSSMEWRPISHPVIVMWGWSGAMLSNEKINPVKHRVVDPIGYPIIPRRLSAAVFVAPNLDVELNIGTLFPAEMGTLDVLNVKNLKKRMAQPWRAREGTKDD